jgi:hypothetical protein
LVDKREELEEEEELREMNEGGGEGSLLEGDKDMEGIIELFKRI